MMRLSGKVAIISGGVSGLGKASAIMFAREGAKVVITDIREDGAEDVITQIKRADGDAIFVKHDVTVEAQWEAVVDRALREYGSLSIVVNSAGVASVGAGNIEETSYEEFVRINKVNYDGVFLGTKHGIRGMRQSGAAGSIINLSSIEGLIGDANLAAYNGSKGAVRLLTKSAALWCAKQGYNIRINSIHPGHTMTEMVQNWVASQDNPDATWRMLESAYPMGRLGKPEEIASTLVFLASDECSWMTGTEIVVDGGFTAQ